MFSALKSRATNLVSYHSSALSEVHKLQCASTPSGRLATVQTAGTEPVVCDVAGLEWDMNICISNKLLGDSDFADLRTTL